MKYFIALQLKRFIRYAHVLGIHPFVIALVFATIYILFVSMLFYKTEYANLIIIGIGLIIMLTSNISNSADLYIQNISKEQNLRLRLGTSCFLLSPILFTLLFYRSFIGFFLFISLATLIQFYSPKLKFSRAIRTPFKKSPFEYPIGFRLTFPILILLVLLQIKAIHVDNFHLAAFTLGVALFISISYTTRIEPVYYVWIFDSKPREFLLFKIKMSVLNSTILASPFFILCCLFYIQNIHILVLILLVSYLINALIILVKYSVFPKEIGISQGILLALTVSFPLLIIYTFPMFYKKAIQNLKPILV